MVPAERSLNLTQGIRSIMRSEVSVKPQTSYADKLLQRCTGCVCSAGGLVQGFSKWALNQNQGTQTEGHKGRKVGIKKSAYRWASGKPNDAQVSQVGTAGFLNLLP